MLSSIFNKTLKVFKNSILNSIKVYPDSVPVPVFSVSVFSLTVFSLPSVFSFGEDGWWEKKILRLRLLLTVFSLPSVFSFGEDGWKRRRSPSSPSVKTGHGKGEVLRSSLLRFCASAQKRRRRTRERIRLNIILI